MLSWISRLAGGLPFQARRTASAVLPTELGHRAGPGRARTYLAARLARGLAVGLGEGGTHVFGCLAYPAVGLDGVAPCAGFGLALLAGAVIETQVETRALVCLIEHRGPDAAEVAGLAPAVPLALIGVLP